MLRNTFCHLSGITVAGEQGLWSSGVRSWESLLETDAAKSACKSTKRREKVALQINQSRESLENHDPIFFAEQLPSSLHWRFFPDFKHSIAYLDIETTGLDRGDIITTIVIYDGKSIHPYVQGQNLDDFKNDIEQYKIIATYNGKSFDVPFIERYFKIKIKQPNIDLRYILSSLGYSGGLKNCERKLGIDRKDLADIDGYAAVLLWNDYKRSKNQKALETLLAYNVTDVLNLETLLVFAYNEKLLNTPFQNSHKLPFPTPPENPFKADENTLRKVCGIRP